MIQVQLIKNDEHEYCELLENCFWRTRQLPWPLPSSQRDIRAMVSGIPKAFWCIWLFVPPEIYVLPYHRLWTRRTNASVEHRPTEDAWARLTPPCLFWTISQSAHEQPNGPISNVCMWWQMSRYPFMCGEFQPWTVRKVIAWMVSNQEDLWKTASDEWLKSSPTGAAKVPSAPYECSEIQRIAKEDIVPVASGSSWSILILVVKKFKQATLPFGNHWRIGCRHGRYQVGDPASKHDWSCGYVFNERKQAIGKFAIKSRRCLREFDPNPQRGPAS